MSEIPTPQSCVMSTMREDGSRRWLYPRLSAGRFWHARRVLAYVLIAVFTLIPYVKLGGKPLILLDIPARQFTILGFTFLPTDTLLLALFMVTLIVGVCLATALAGRVWCGWMCPQTVYMEFVYRPLERLLDGLPFARHRPGNKATPLRTAVKYAVYLLLSAYLAHTFLAYFVGVEALAQWVRRSPIEHPVSFLVMLAVTGLMLFDFSYFREQMCLVACPYGRFQSVMLDRQSLIVSYDARRGEPRGHRRAKSEADSKLGDCIDCLLCLDTCPTGIDIRDGLQMECVACTQCIDACDQVMDRLHKPRGLIRFSSQARIEGQAARMLRPRVVIYPALMLLLVTVFAVVLARKQTADVTLLRGVGGAPFTQLASGEIVNQIRVKITNRTTEPAVYKLAVVAPDVAQLKSGGEPLEIAAGQSRTAALMIALPPAAFRGGLCTATLRISDSRQFTQDVTSRLLGPEISTKP